MTGPTRPSTGDHASEDELVTYAVQPDRVPLDVTQHIVGCRRCQAVIDQYHLLDAALFRSECPEMDTLQAYALDALAAGDRAIVAAHTQDCPLCQQDLATIRAVVLGGRGEGVQPAATSAASVHPSWEELRERARRIIAQLVPSEPSLGFALKSGDDNSDGSQAVSFYAAAEEGLEVALRWSHSPEGITLLGRILGAEQASSAYLVLSRGMQDWVGTKEDILPPHPVAEAAIAPSGSFELGPVPSGIYTLEILLGDRLVVIAALDL